MSQPSTCCTGTPNPIEGLEVMPDFVTSEEERALLAWCGVSATVPGSERNRVVRYGPGVKATRYVQGVVVHDMPTILQKLCERVAATGVPLPNAVSVNEYHAGQGLEYHLDHDAAGEVVSTLGLASSADLAFRQRYGDRPIVVKFRPRTLIQMRGACRKHWQHAILPVSELRYSIVFRRGSNAVH